MIPNKGAEAKIGACILIRRASRYLTGKKGNEPDKWRQAMRKKNVWIVFLAAGLSLFAIDALADWSVAKRLTWTSGDSKDPSVAIDSNNHIHIVWWDETPGISEIYYKRSIDGGTTWGAVKRLTWTSGWSYYPTIAIDSSDHIHVVWEDYAPGNAEIYHKKSTDGGTTWSANKRLTWTSDNSYVPVIAIDSSDTLHVVWYDETSDNSEIYYKNSTDGGTTWSTTQRLTWTSDFSYDPVMAIDSSDTLHVVWEDYLPGNDQLYYRRSADGGSTWSTAKRITWTSSECWWPALAIDANDHIHTIWTDYTSGGVYDIYYKRSTNGGTTWSAAQRLSWTSGASNEPAIATDKNNHIHVVWEDDTPGKGELYHKESTDAGVTWNVTQRLTWTSMLSWSAALAIDSSNTIHVVWSDDTPGNAEIYYKRGN